MAAWVSTPLSEHTAEGMICSLAGVCNGAATWDGSGFSKIDASFGHSLAERAMQGRAWSSKQAEAALRLIGKYHRQLGGKEFVEAWLKAPVFRQDPGDRTAERINKPCRILSSRDKDAVFSFSYDQEIVAGIKTIRGQHKGVPFRAIWDPSARIWTVPVNETSIGPIMAVARRFGFDIEERFDIYQSKVDEKNQEDRVMLALNDGTHVTVAVDTIIICVEDQEIADEFRKELM